MQAVLSYLHPFWPWLDSCVRLLLATIKCFFLHFFLGKRGTGSDTHFWEPINISFFRAKLRVDLTCVFPTHVLSVFLSLSSSSSLFLGVTFLLSFLPVTNVYKRFDLFVFPLLCFVPSFFIAVLHVIHFITFFFLSLSLFLIYCFYVPTVLQLWQI